jgi:septal ring factor EnvC (AmiA/AmiB activator)
LTVSALCNNQAEVFALLIVTSEIVAKIYEFRKKEDSMFENKQVKTATFVYCLMFALGGPLMAAEPVETKKDIKKELQADRKEIKSDKKELRSDRKEFRQDKKDLREARKEGASKETLQKMRSEIKQDKKEIAQDKKELRSDRKERREDRKDFNQAK